MTTYAGFLFLIGVIHSSVRTVHPVKDFDLDSVIHEIKFILCSITVVFFFFNSVLNVSREKVSFQKDFPWSFKA